jgi:hypothetical protein
LKISEEGKNAKIVYVDIISESEKLLDENTRPAIYGKIDLITVKPSKKKNKGNLL